MTSRFVRPETAVLTLANGDTLIVKRRLTAGEQRASYARASLVGSDGLLHANPIESGLALILAYLLDWHLAEGGLDGKPVVIAGQPIDAVAAALNAIDYASFVEIKEAIEAHEQAMLAERRAEKNGPDGGTPSPGISPSPSAAAGALSGSES